MNLPYDVSRCATNCDLPCRRKEPGHPKYQSYTLFPGGADCYARIEPDDRMLRDHALAKAEKVAAE